MEEVELQEDSVVVDGVTYPVAPFVFYDRDTNSEGPFGNYRYMFAGKYPLMRGIVREALKEGKIPDVTTWEEWFKRMIMKEVEFLENNPQVKHKLVTKMQLRTILHQESQKVGGDNNRKPPFITEEMNRLLKVISPLQII